MIITALALLSFMPRGQCQARSSDEATAAFQPQDAGGGTARHEGQQAHQGGLGEGGGEQQGARPGEE
ncbi:hypothetical protein [Streptomyces sp. NBC_00114]|uniref:hypothetical protein n=1 Tax=Streptomyces sp. NBC_00114 TaxID=2975656 RepID=UPI003870EC95